MAVNHFQFSAEIGDCLSLFGCDERNDFILAALFEDFHKKESEPLRQSRFYVKKI
jgi:hypothetical protein